jgi:hypothetical protein
MGGLRNQARRPLFVARETGFLSYQYPVGYARRKKASTPTFSEQWSRSDRQLVVSKLHTLLDTLKEATSELKAKIDAALRDEC